MTQESGNPEKKIVIDEDWKSQVEAEREALRHPEETKPPPRAAEGLPPPSLIFLAGTLYLQAAIALGLLPDPSSDKPSEADFARAKHSIDTLAVLQEKTEGNRTPEETAEIEAMLHQVRLAYIEVKEHAGVTKAV